MVLKINFFFSRNNFLFFSSYCKFNVIFSTNNIFTFYSLSYRKFYYSMFKNSFNLVPKILNYQVETKNVMNIFPINKKTPNSNLRVIDHVNKLKLSNIGMFFSSNCFNFPYLKKTLIYFSLNNFDSERSIVFVRMLWLIEQIFLKKGFIGKYKSIRVGKNDRRVIFSVKTTLNKFFLKKFIYSFIFFAFENFRKKLLFLPKELSIDFFSYIFTIKDVNVFPGYIESFFKWPYPLFVRMEFFKNILKVSYVTNKYSIQEFGFVV